MTKPMSFEEFVSKKRKRPVEVCFKCGKQKEIYTHLNGEEDKPLCNTCNMQERRNSPGAIQVKLVKLCATAMGSVEAMLALPIEEGQKKTLQDMQDELKLMIRVWLGDPQADEEADDVPATAQVTEAPTDSVSDEFTEARITAVSKENDKLFEAPERVPSKRKRRKALIASKVKQRKAAKAAAKTDAATTIVAPDDHASDPAYQAYLEAPLA